MCRFSKIGRLRAGLATGVAALAAAACTGDNAFSGGTVVNTSTDVTVDIEEPSAESSTQSLGDSLLVTARVRAGRGITEVVYEGFAVRGDPDLGTEELIPRFTTKTANLQGVASDTLLSRFLMPTSDETREQVFVVVAAKDVDGAVAADTAKILIGGTKVEVLDIEDGQSVQAGLSLSVRVRGTDPDGILQLQIDVTGAFEETIVKSFNPPVDSAAMDTVVVIPAGTTGAISLVASARNTLDLLGFAGPFTLNVGSSGAGDTQPPEVLSSATSEIRMELKDPVNVTVSGVDNNSGSGVSRAGYTVLAISPIRGDTLIQSDEQIYTPPRTGNVVTNFQFTPFNVDSLALPDTLVFEVTGYMVDGNGNCAASVGGAAPERLPCTTLPGGQIAAQERAGERLVRSIVAGRTVFLPAGGLILDAEVDTIRRSLFLSNHDRDQIEIFGLQSESFLPAIPVGSEPWGLELNRGEDTLLVANSGGTNISNVYLGPPVNLNPPYADHVEDPGRRIVTPDVVLFDVERRVDDIGALRYRVTFHPDASPPGFSDRPQFMAVDSTGRVLYSTKTTLAGDFGTIRRAWVPTGQNLVEVRLFYEHGDLIDAPDFVAVANVDNIGITSTPLNDLATIFDHTPGTTDVIANDPPELIELAASSARALGSDVEIFSGRWSVPNIGFHDTTFVAASGDRGWVVFGEGSIEPIGRVIMYDASTDRLSGVIPVTDLLTNASETVRGVSLNHDGTLGVARGFQGYFFSRDLRLQGVADLPAGGAGAALHPLHANYPSRENLSGRYDPDTHLAFLGTGQGTIDIVDAFHFNRVGRLFIKDVVAGPLRAVLPFPEDNAAFQCQSKTVLNGTGQVIGQAVDIFADEQGTIPYPPDGGPTDDRCVVIKLFGITSNGGVVVVDVRKGDILREHPARL
jgi:hypothetical protein